MSGFGADRIAQLEKNIRDSQEELDLLMKDGGVLADFLDLPETHESSSARSIVIAWEAFKAAR